MDDNSTVEYWDKRAIEYKNRPELMFFASPLRFQLDDMAKKILVTYKDNTVVDIACGNGRFCELFDPTKYIGYDFSSELIAQARELHPGYRFEVANVHTNRLSSADIVFEVISLDMLRMNPEEFNRKYSEYAKQAVVCIQTDRVNIFVKIK